MSGSFEELDYCATPIGALSLRRRYDPTLGHDVFEVKLGDEYLMSSAYTVSEIALAELGLAAFEGASCDVLIGGLGLGYTAKAALGHRKTRSVLVAEFFPAVVDWHEKGVLPLGRGVAGDPRTQFVIGDFFSMAERLDFGDRRGEGVFDAILLDIDHSPDALLSEHSRPFYEAASLAHFGKMLRPGGIFGLWSDDPPDEAFLSQLSAAFGEAWAEPVSIDRPLAGTPIVQTVYLARAVGSMGGEEKTSLKTTTS